MRSEKENKEEKIGRKLVYLFAVLIIAFFIYIFASIQL